MRRAAQVEVVEGLVEGDVVVTAGQLKLREGAPVRTVGDSAPATPASAAAPAPAPAVSNEDEICIKRPVFATVLSPVVMLLGLVSYDRLPVREYPKIDEPVVTVDTTYRGASADIIESQVTKPMEDSLAGREVELSRHQSRGLRTARFRFASSWSGRPIQPRPMCVTASASVTNCRLKPMSR